MRYAHDTWDTPGILFHLGHRPWYVLPMAVFVSYRDTYCGKRGILTTLLWHVHTQWYMLNTNITTDIFKFAMLNFYFDFKSCRLVNIYLSPGYLLNEFLCWWLFVWMQCSLLSLGGKAKDSHISLLINAGILVSEMDCFIAHFGCIQKHFCFKLSQLCLEVFDHIQAFSTSFPVNGQVNFIYFLANVVPTSVAFTFLKSMKLLSWVFTSTFT